jgi:hypothetical protein
VTTKKKPNAHYERKRRAAKGDINPLEARSCPQEKIAFRTKKIALSQTAKAAKFGKILWQYKCPYCHLYHLTSQEPAS